MVIRSSQRGFTLLEVLVALAILAIALAAMVQAASYHVSNAAYLRDRTLAHWVAMNKMAEIHLTREWPELGTASGSETMAGHEWRWARRVSETPDEDIRRIEVDVFSGPDSEQALETLVGFLGRPR